MAFAVFNRELIWGVGVGIANIERGLSWCLRQTCHLFSCERFHCGCDFQVNQSDERGLLILGVVINECSSKSERVFTNEVVGLPC